MSFNPASFGLLSHYSPQSQQRIRRLMLEDWKGTGVKLPTYMKLVARFIAASGVPEAWLGKLSHQTMDKMLKSASTPRYEFWACLHFYLNKKYGPVDIDPLVTDADILGQALVRFASIKQTAATGRYEIDGREVELVAEAGRPYAFAEATQTRQGHKPFGVETEYREQGIAVIQHDRLIVILCDIASQRISTIELEASV